MKNSDFTYNFYSSRPVSEIFADLVDVRRWWSGVYDETIEGHSEKKGDTFNFTAGGGMHHTTQKLTQLIPDKSVEWLVTAANLTFTKKTDEWLNTSFGFNLTTENGKTKILFTHRGLNPDVECYNMCSNGWREYLKKLEANLS